MNFSQVAATIETLGNALVRTSDVGMCRKGRLESRQRLGVQQSPAAFESDVARGVSVSKFPEQASEKLGGLSGCESGRGLPHSKTLARLPRWVAIFAVLGLWMSAPLMAQESTPPERSEQEQSREQEPARKGPAAGKAISFPISYTGEGLANFSGGYRRGAIYEGLLSVGIQGDLEKAFGWKDASFLVSAIYPHGSSLTNNYVHDFNGVSNIDAFDSVRLYEAWFQQEFAGGKVSLRLGQLLADAEFFVSENAALLVNGAFGAIPLVSMNFEAPVYPVAAPGIRLRVDPTDALSIQAALFSGDAGDPATNNQHGVSWRFSGRDGALALLEADLKTPSGKDDPGLRGVYKVGLFYHSGNFENRGTESRNRSGDFGGYFIADHQIWRKAGGGDEGLSGFLRIGAALPDRNVVPFYTDAGFAFKGPIPGRKDDVACLGVSYTSLKDGVGETFSSHHETILEATYKIVLHDWLFVQPDFQYIFTPGGDHATHGAFVAGVRFSLSFQ